jgi:hypothetical protein
MVSLAHFNLTRNMMFTEDVHLMHSKSYGSTQFLIFSSTLRGLGAGKGSPSMLYPTIVDRLETTEVNSSDVMSSMQPSESSIVTGRGSFAFALSFSFITHSNLSLFLSSSFSFSIYRDRTVEVVVAVGASVCS